MDQYILYTLETALPDLLEFGIIAPAPHSASASVHLSSPVESLRRELNHLASKVILPASIGLVDGFGFSDFDLDTAVSYSRVAAWHVSYSTLADSFHHTSWETTMVDLTRRFCRRRRMMTFSILEDRLLDERCTFAAFLFQASASVARFISSILMYIALYSQV